MEHIIEANDRKALVITTVASTIDQFCMNDIAILSQSFQVQVAANFTKDNNTSVERIAEFKEELKSKNIIIHEIKFNRKPFSGNNLIAYLQVKKLIKENSFELIHCHTPVAAMLVRLAARKMRKRGTKVIYTAHGFHFYKGSSLTNWILFYPIEKWLAGYTDVLITINQEDYNRALKFRRAGEVRYIPGVGIDTRAIREIVVDKEQKREELGIPDDAFLVMSVGELNRNKNHEVVLKAMAKLRYPNLYYVICGRGRLEEELRGLSESLDLSEKVRLLGYRRDIIEICKSADAFVHPSYREGLPVALLEAMACGLPAICSDIRGNRDLIENAINGFLIKPADEAGFANAMQVLTDGSSLSKNMGELNRAKAEGFDIGLIRRKMTDIYYAQIPRIIHYCWFGRGEKSELIKACMKSWRRYCPSYIILEWNEDNFDIISNSYVKEAYASGKWAFVSDYVRLYVLYHFGGIYCDTDVEIRKPLDTFLSHEAFSGFEARDSVPTGIMGSRKGNSRIGDLLSDYEHRHFIREDGTLDLTTNVVGISAAFAAWGLIFNNKKQRIKGFIMYPMKYFCPNSLGQVFGIPKRSSYTVHHFAASWKNDHGTGRDFKFRVRRYLVGKLRNIVGSRKVESLGERKHRSERG